jgi:hypothetical protein
MYTPPSADQAYDFENGFYLTCQPGRLGKAIAHYELYRMAMVRPGLIVEAGVFKGASLCRFAAFRALLESAETRGILAFDAFGSFPPTEYGPDQAKLAAFTRSAGDESIGVEDLQKVLVQKRCSERVELIAGNILYTVPRYVEAHPEARIALLNLDVDVYEPNVTVLEHLWPLVVRGGVLVLDDYGIFPGATKATDDYFRGTNVEIRKFPFAHSPTYIVKT